MILSLYPDRALSIRAKALLNAFISVLAESIPISESNTRMNSTLEAELEDIRQSRNGDSEAYRRLIEQHQEHVSRILWRFSRNRQVHEELVQDVFVEAYLNLADYRQKAPFAHWLARIATRIGYRYWKQKARRQKTKTFSFEDWDEIASPVEHQIDASHAAVLVHSLLAQLPPRDRLVLTLRYFDECSVAETARRTGWTKTMVKVQSLRARNKLEKLLHRMGKETVL